MNSSARQVDSSEQKLDGLYGTVCKVLHKKNFAFIRSPELKVDVFITMEVFTEVGIIPELGMEVVFNAFPASKGYRAKSVRLAKDEEKVNHSESEMVSIKWFNQKSGYGYVRTADKGEIFFHCTVCEKAGIDFHLLQSGFKLRAVIACARGSNRPQVLKFIN